LRFLPNLKGATFYRDNSRKYVDDSGNEQEPPLKPISIEEAKSRFDVQSKTEAKAVNDCISGICEITYESK
jgi:hypothetical protein